MPPLPRYNRRPVPDVFDPAWLAAEFGAVERAQAAGAYLPLAGGTLTGPVTGTSAMFGGGLTVGGPGLSVSAGGIAVTGNSTIAGTLGGITTLTATTLVGTLATAAQPNVTSVGTLAGLTVGGAGVSIAAGGLSITGGITFGTDNAYDIGAAAANRPRNVYVAGTMAAASFTGIWNGYGHNLAGGPFAGAPDSFVGLSGTTLQRYNQAALAAFLVGATVPGAITVSGSGTFSGGLVVSATGGSDLVFNEPPTAGIQIQFGNGTVNGSVGVTYSGGDTYLGYNALQSAKNADGWAQQYAGLASTLLDVNSGGMSLYSAVAGHAAGTYAGFWGTAAVTLGANGNVTATGNIAGADGTFSRSATTGYVYFGSNAAQWIGYNGSDFDVHGGTNLAGRLIWSADNTYDIGQSGANRPRNLWLGSGIDVAGGSTFHGGAAFSSAVSVTGTATLAGDLSHTGSNIGFFGTAARPKGTISYPTSYTLTNFEQALTQVLINYGLLRLVQTGTLWIVS